MRWPWRRPAPEPNHDDRKEEIKEAREARKSSEHDLARIREMREEVSEVVDHLRDIRTRNHLAEAFVKSIKRREPGHG